MGSDSSRFKVLGDYLRSRRNRLQPQQAGLSGSYNQRRTPGLRREEVALLAGVSCIPGHYGEYREGPAADPGREQASDGAMESL
ncbi:hypothetical protein [Paenibacillus graminis]